MLSLVKTFKLCTLAVVLFSCGCSEYLAENNARERSENKIVKKRIMKQHFVSNSAIEEYVNRVAKKIILVSDKPSSKLEFRVNGSTKPYLSVTRYGKVDISYGFLKELDDEAELAAVLAQSIVKIYNGSDNASPNSETALLREDKLGLEYLFRAGYDPKALVDLQERFVQERLHYGDHWLNGAYQTNPPSSSRIAANKKVIDRLPKGLLRGAERYRQHIGA